MEKKLDGNYTRMLPSISNKSWRKHPTKQQLYGYLPPIMTTIQVRWARHLGHCWRSRDELISDMVLSTPHLNEQRQDVQLEPTYNSSVPVQDEDLLGVMNDREEWWERVREIHAGSSTWCWWNISLSWKRLWQSAGVTVSGVYQL